jgi:hypothetical protein
MEIQHTAREKLLQRETPSFIPPTQWPPNSPDLNPVDYAIWGIMKQKVYRTKTSNLEELHGMRSAKQSSMHPSDNGASAVELVLQPTADTLNTICDCHFLCTNMKMI